MAISDLNNTHLSAAKILVAKNALTALETALTEVNIQLTAEDRQRYGNINEQNKLFVNKIIDYQNKQPTLK